MPVVQEGFFTYASQGDDMTEMEFDYIVIGGGSTGCVVANRLSEDAGNRVLLLEAGGPDTNPAIHDPGRVASLWGSEVDWAYFTEEEPGLNGRKIMCNRGKVMGGSSAIHAMIFIRGNPLDFDHWNYLGNEGWSYRDVLPYFRKSEDYAQGASEFHGAGGPMQVTDLANPSQVAQAFVSGAVELGYKGGREWDFNAAEHSDGAGYYQFNIGRDGKRVSGATAFITPIMGRSNLTVVSGALAERLEIQGRRVVGVRYRHREQALSARAAREVIVSAGAFDSPKLLMLSGIGPAEELRRHGITVRADLPGVGRNLQDHLLMPVVFYSKRPQPEPVVLAEAGLLVRTVAGSDKAAPDLQINFNASIKALLPPEVDKQRPSFTFITILVRPQSLGSVTLRSADVADAPVIRANYLSCAADVEVQVNAVKLCRRIASTDAMSEFFDGESLPGADKTDAELREYVRSHVSTIWHPVGTCKMGKDALAVVDPQLRVHGLEGLRVADASIMPSAVSSNPNAACFMIGEKTADLIRASR